MFVNKTLLTDFVTEIKDLITGKKMSEGQFKQQVEALREDLSETRSLLKKSDRDMEVNIEKGIDKTHKDMEKDSQATKIENATLKAQNEILNGAFKELGLDVKDVKGIVDKLVEGLVAGSQVKIINATTHKD